MKFSVPAPIRFRANASRQRGVALAIAVILLGVLLVFTSVSATLMTSEARQTSAQYLNTRTYNAAMAYLESMTSNFNVLFATNQNPSPAEINNLVDPGRAPKLKTSSDSLYRFTADAPYVPPSVGQQRTTQIKTPPYDGLNAIERRYVIGATAHAIGTGGADQPAEARIIRELSNYQVPIFQFAAFGFDNLEISPGPRLDLGGRAHVNRHLFLSASNGPINFWGRVTVVGQVCTLVKINGFANGGTMNVYQPSSTSLVAVQPSVPSGTAPDFTSGTTAIVSPSVDWNIADDPATPNATGGTPGTAGPTGLVISNVAPLLLPTQTQNFNPIEIIRRANPNEQQFLDPPDNTLVNPLLASRYFNGRQPVQGSVIRILLDDDLADFPTGGPGPLAYDLDRLSNPQDALFNAFWMANNPNVRQFNPFGGSDLPDASSATNPAGTGGTAQTFNASGVLTNANNQRVLPPQTNIVNRQPEFESDGNNGSITASRKHSYIKIELLVNNNPPNPPVRYDITPHILNLGITSGPIPMTTVNGTAPSGVENTMTYNAVYALNDGGSIRRLQNPTMGDSPDNFLPFLAESTTNAFIGEFAQAFGAAPAISLSYGNPGVPSYGNPALLPGNQSVNTTFWFEPNSILTFQRTNIPFSPQDYRAGLTEHVSMTYADAQTVSDRGVNVNSTLLGRVDGNGQPTNSAAGYPAKFKSLIAKPYFRFTDDFLNNSYVKGSFDPGPDGVAGNADDTFLMANPFRTLPKTQVFNDESPSRDDKRMERFARKVRVCAARVRTSTGVVGTGTPQADTATPRYSVTQLTSSATGPLNPSVTLTSANPTVVPNFTTDYNALLANNTNFWTNNPSTVGDNGRILKIERTIDNFLRQNIFVPGIPGFYALANNNRNPNGTLNTTTGYERSGVDVTGDNLLDTEVGLNNGFAGPNSSLNTTTTTAATAGAVPTNYVASTDGVTDIQELTPFANISDAALLRRALFTPASLSAADQERLFPHLLQRSRTELVTRILEALEIGTPGRNTDPSMTGFNVNGIPEMSKENLCFDWNGDGVIEPPHLPFQTGSTIPETVGSTTAGAASSVGYSVESNVNALLPSSLRVLHDQPAVNTLNTTENATTSKPIELIFWEADSDGSNGGGTTETWDTTTYQGQALTNADFAALAPLVAGSANLLGQADPGSKAQAATFAPSTGFTETGTNRNCWRIKVPYNTFGGTVTVGSPAVTVNVREAVAIVFQHPLASRVYNSSDPTAVAPKVAIGIDSTGTGPTTSTVGTGNQIPNLNMETQIGRRLGQGDAHYSFPGHAFVAFQPNVNPALPPTAGSDLIPKLRIVMDQAFPINVYDQREGRHFSRNYAFQGIATAADYYTTDVGAGGGQILQANWPNWPASGTGANQLADTQRILADMGQRLPQPSPVAYERRGVLSVTEFNMGNLKRLFRGDFNGYLAQADALTAAIHGTLGAPGNPAGFVDGRPRDNPNTPEVEGTNSGLIDITDNGFIVYFSDRRGDDNNDGIYEFNDVFGENNVLNELDNCIENDPAFDGIANSPGPKPGDGKIRRDVEVETQPINGAGGRRTPDLNNPARTGEGPHGSIPVNDGFEYFSGNIIRNGTRRIRIFAADGSSTETVVVNNANLLPADALLSQLSTAGARQGGGGTAGEGGVFWRMVDSAKTGRVRAFRRALRLINAQDIPRWYISRPDGQDRGFTGLALVTENPMFSYGNVNTIGVANNLAPTAPFYSFDTIAAGGPTRSEDYCQTGNANRPAGEDALGTFGNDMVNNPNDRILHGSLSLMADGITIHSNAWQDGRMFICPFGTTKRPQQKIQRYAARTFVKAAWLTGTGKAGDGQNNITGQCQTNNNDAADMSDSDANNTQGGLHNFPRFTEDWGGAGGVASSANFNYNGSFIFQFYSHQANGPWMIRGPNTDGGTSLYNAPNPRNWNFDVSFTRANGIPPGTPRLTFYKNGSFRQIFLENNPN
jgi:hypothetical protein